MANADRPIGFVPLSEHEIISLKSDGSAAIFIGDPVKPDGSGRYLSITNDADNPAYVAISYTVATAGTVFQAVKIKPGQEFLCQVDDGTLTDDTALGNSFDIILGSGNTTTLISGFELDGDASAEDTLKLVRLYDTPDNAWGTNANVVVEFRVNVDAQVITTT